MKKPQNPYYLRSGEDIGFCFFTNFKMDLVTQIKKNKPDFNCLKVWRFFYSKKIIIFFHFNEKKTHSDKYPVE